MRTKIVTALAFVFFITINAQDKKWTLQECVNYALENNISIKRSELNIELKNEEIVNRKSGLYPTVSASTSQRLTFGSAQDRVTFRRVNATSHSTSIGINAGITIFNGFRIINQVEQARIGLEASKYDLEKLKDDISLTVVNSYLNVLFNKENLKIAKSQIEVSQKQVSQISRLVEAGVQPKSNLLEVEANLANDEQKVVTAQNSLDLALLDLAQTLQLDYVGFDVENIIVNTPSELLMYDKALPIYKIALENRSEIKSAKLNVLSASKGIDIAKSGFLPTLSFNYNFGSAASFLDLASISNKAFFYQLDNNKNNSFSLSLNIPIFSGFRIKSNVNSAKINYEISQFNLEDTKIQLRKIIERAFMDAKAALKTYVAAEKNVTSQELSFKNSQESYNLGVMTSFDFEQVKNRFLNAQASLINAKYDFVFRTKVLDFYVGKSLID
ncbi:Efflux transport system, outer membrane factor (OMF) lipoprotein [hydrothermal vent metagenome]|uniref:Efflux transport system, outer membrane factor (OMF) lipoprotein n=1 Tax=hydrothermal vent metagenome TaxID=652676 RepID=A0A3B0UNF5_9ZZZZ